ncbi:MAG TPA: type II secretion system inner membrane protein GspF [Casimicrobiaceae bacterium]|nr:type II secretion system inner membrane protein GspF [Casimicrobiaceae bacterium]
MPAFRYEAVDGAGRARRGLLEAASARAVRDVLRGDGLFPTAVEPASRSFATRTDATRLAAPTLALITRQLATLVASGMPLDQALAAVAEQADHPGAVRLLGAIRDQVAAGESFAGALSRFPRTFSPLYRGLAAVGAESGQLGSVLSRLGDYLETRQLLRQRFTAALIYPALVTLVALAVIGALLLYVVPQIVAVYQQSRQTLPWLTRALIASSGFVRATGWYWLGALLLGGAVAALMLRRERWRERAQGLLLRTPVIGTVLSGLDTARFASTLSILTGSGAPLLRALETAAGVIWAAPIRHAAHAAAAHVREGVSLARALASQRVFPALLVHLVANGEQSGQLPAMLDRAAREQDADVERRLTWLAALVQPVLIVIMGGIVLVLVLAVMLPIVSMNQLIR